MFGQNEHPCRKQKTCSMIEYHETHQTQYSTQQFVYSFEYAIESPKSSVGERKLVPYKVVRTEYLIWNGISLIAGIGGTLGPTIGFSFIGAVEWLSSLLKMLGESWAFKKCLAYLSKYQVFINYTKLNANIFRLTKK